MNPGANTLIHDWNRADCDRRQRNIAFDDETLRDGLQSPSVTNPPLESKLRFLHRLAPLGIHHADVGIPGSSPSAARDAEALCREIVDAHLDIQPNCAARTAQSDIVPILDLAQRVGRPVEIMLFLGSSPIRAYVEGWSPDELVLRTERWVRFAVERGAPVTFVTEDTTRSAPEDLARLFETAVRVGAGGVCVADTAGHATPLGAHRIVRFVRRVVRAAGGAGVRIDWHGHNDRGLAVTNALAAVLAGAERIHATAFGVGERVGNPPMEQLLVNARLLGWAHHDVSRLMEYVEEASAMLAVEIPHWAPMVGRDAFRTSTGVHAAAILKARDKGDEDLADLVYSAVPASWLGRGQVIDVGPMSGVSNVRCWLREHGYRESSAVIEKIFAAAKEANRTLSEDELHTLASAEPNR